MVDFLIIGPDTIVQYNNVFPLIRDRRIYYGFKRDRGHLFFFDSEGKVMDVSGIRWWQNLIDAPPGPMVFKKSIKDGYKKFDDSDIINIDDYRDIPGDYDGLIGVPITFYRHWNPDQFEMVDMKKEGCVVDGVGKFVRLIIRRK